jgi:7,8-dihydro-6-hydroxymethylpterin dimethyltransferase
MNRALCNRCRQLVPARHEERDHKIFLVKDCKTCGATETLLSSHSDGYWRKRKMDEGFQYGNCGLSCLSCQHKEPNVVFLDITNRCNLNCPVCINNTPSMGFLFEPPIEYFDTIFKHFAQVTPKPSIQIFGGEPTVRKDLIEIIRLSRSYGFPTRVLTNGIRLADEEYCRQVVETRATILISYDGENAALYRALRNHERCGELKRKAVDNIGRLGGTKVVLMMLVAKGYNDKELASIFSFCHERRDFIRGLYLMPLAHCWDPHKVGLNQERITTEDLEQEIEEAFPEDRVEFVPTNLAGRFPTLSRVLGIRDAPFVGGHPNCESMYLLISDGQRYRPLAHYLKGSLSDAVKDLLKLEERLAAREKALERGLLGHTLARLRLRRVWLKLVIFKGVAGLGRRHIRIGEVLGARGPAVIWRALRFGLGILCCRKTKTVLRRFSAVQAALQIIVLPQGDGENIDTDRLQRCPSAFAYVDPKDGRVKHVPNCAWGLHKAKALREIADHYAQTAPAAAPVQTAAKE